MWPLLEVVPREMHQLLPGVRLSQLVVYSCVNPIDHLGSCEIMLILCGIHNYTLNKKPIFSNLAYRFCKPQSFIRKHLFVEALSVLFVYLCAVRSCLICLFMCH